MSASSVASPPRIAADDCVVLPHVSWETYECILADDEERRVPRMTYDRGVLELVTPSMPHEEDADTIAALVRIVAETLDIPIRSVRSTTFRRQDLEQGFEPDASFYVQNEAQIRGRRQVDLRIDPPPDLVLEMEMSRSALNKLALFASMGIPEVWRSNGEQVTIYILKGNHFEQAAASLALPVLTDETIAHFLMESRLKLSPAWSRMVRDWVREQRTYSS